MLLLFTSNVFADMYKCEDSEGMITYTELPCAEERLTYLKKIVYFEEKQTAARAPKVPDPKVDYLDKVSKMAECAGLHFSHHDSISDSDKTLKMFSQKVTNISAIEMFENYLTTEYSIIHTICSMAI